MVISNYIIPEFAKEKDYACDPIQDGTGMKLSKDSKHLYIVHSNLVDAINDCSRNQKCTMVFNNKGFEQDFRLCNGIPRKKKSDDIARRNIIYKKSKLYYVTCSVFNLVSVLH